LAAFVGCGTVAHGQAVVIDPVLAATETSGFLTEKLELDKQTKKQKAIIASEVLINEAMNKVHDVENTTLTYLRSASDVLHNVHQIQKVYSLSSDCVSGVGELGRLIKESKRGALLAGVNEAMNQNVIDCAEDIIVFLKPVILGSDKTLLNTAERTYMLSALIHKLSVLKFNIHRMQYNVKYMNWFDLVRLVDKRSWLNAIEMEQIAKSIIKEF